MTHISKPKLWVFSEFFFPDETTTSFIMTKLCNNLVDKYDVRVICGTAILQKTQKSDQVLEMNPLVKVTRIKTLKIDKNNSFLRILNFVILSLSFFYQLIFSVKSKDKVFTVTNPAIFLVLAGFITSLKKLRITILVHDIFPENTIPAGYISNETHIVYQVFKTMFDWSYSRFETIIVLGRDMKYIMESKIERFHRKPKIKVIENWADPNISADNEYVFDNKIVIQYAGNIGAVQGLEGLIHTIKKVKNPQVIFEFVGTGKLKEDLEKFSRDNQLKNIIFKPAYSRQDQNAILNRCSISIVSLSKGMFGLGVPSKSYNILAAGKPILYIGDKNSEIDLMIQENEVGFSFSSNEEVLNFLNSINIKDEYRLKIMGKKARLLSETVYSEDFILECFKQTI